MQKILREGLTCWAINSLSLILGLRLLIPSYFNFALLRTPLLGDL